MGMNHHQLPSLITHPSHFHPLTFLTTPAYSVGSFNCDACGHRGHGFSYHCSYCDFDVHTTCVSKPLSLTHQSHPHDLKLTFSPPYQPKGFSCDICHTMGSNHWLYRCAPCEFDAHMDCVLATFGPIPPTRMQFQRHSSFPGASGNNQQSGMAMYDLHSQSFGTMQSCYQESVIVTGNNGVMGTAVQDFVDGAAQQVGQDFVQNMWCGGGGGGGINDSCGDGAGTSSVLGVTSSILSGMLGNSDEQI